MAFMNTYKPEEKQKFECADGDYLVKVVKVENVLSRTGLNMHKITLQVKNVPVLYEHFVCEGDYYNLSMTRFFDAFKIQRGNFNFNSWINRIAYAHFENKEHTFTGQDGAEHTAVVSRLMFFHNNIPAVNAPEKVNALAQAVNGTVERQPVRGTESPAEFPEDIPF